MRLDCNDPDVESTHWRTYLDGVERPASIADTERGMMLVLDHPPRSDPLTNKPVMKWIRGRVEILDVVSGKIYR